MAGWMDDVSRQVWGLLQSMGIEARQQGLLSLMRPIAPFNQPHILAPVVTIGALLTFLMLSGVAVAALGALLTALLALYILLVQVFGVSIEVHPFGVR